MYQPPHFREDRLDVQHALMRAHPLGLLISSGAGGLMANPVPFILHADASERGTLACHVSRANPHWRELSVVEECLVVFQGPQEYITPTWYETKRETGKVVPTWNYATVHAWGKPHVTNDTDWLRRNVEALTRAHEGARALPWEVNDAPPEFVAAQLRGIVGIEIPITRIEGKWKVSQNRTEKDRAGVVSGLRKQGDASEPMAQLVAERLKPAGN
jgi:transcriptional regulator